jgi:uncharacterized RDD family membrane protein YckC
MAPQTVENLSNHNAGFVSRLIAFSIDLVILAGIDALVIVFAGLLLGFFGLDAALSAPRGGESVMITILRVALIVSASLFNVVLISGYLLLFWLLAGQTPGKALIGLAVVSVTGEPITWWQAVRRLLGYWISALPFFLGFFWVLIDDRRQGWHDKFARTRVVYSSRESLLRIR